MTDIPEELDYWEALNVEPADKSLPVSGMDPECVRICEAINLIPGIWTIESCCGHDERPFRVWFKVRDLEQLPNLLYWIDTCHSGAAAMGWRVSVKTDCAKQYPTFCLEGPVGAFADADELAENISEDMRAIFAEQAMAETEP